jgi:glycosyltransferase involved in cell wall biosynthesis
MPEHPIVTVIVPCRNEVEHVVPFLQALLRQRVPARELEVVVADGQSDDGTRELLDRFQQHHASIHVVDNPRGIVSTGLNSAIRAARGEIIVRMDVHTAYADDYLAECVQALDTSGADSVGGPWVAAGSGYLSSAVAVAFQSPFVSGGGRARRPNYQGPVDTVYLGCWRRQAFDRFGFFDEGLIRNQDDEFNLRIRRRGGKLWQTPRIRSWYRPRSSLRELFRQQAQYGYWKVRVIRKHQLPALLRHLVPGFFLLWLVTLGAVLPFSGIAAWAFLSTVGAYALASVIFTGAACWPVRRWRYAPMLPVIFAIFHFGYGYGFLRGIIDFVIMRKGHRTAFATLTRDRESQ